MSGRAARLLTATAIAGALTLGTTATAQAGSYPAQPTTPSAATTPTTAGQQVAALQVAALQTPARVTLHDLDRHCDAKGRVLCISKNTDKLYYLKDRRILKTMDARFGCARTKTRQGTFHITRKSRHHVSSIYHTSMPYAMFFSGGQAVHYSPDFAARGYRGCSHGCVNIRNRSGIAWLFDQMKVGDRVVVYKH